MISSGNIRVKKIYAGATAVSRVYVGTSKIFPDIVLTAVPKTYTFAYQTNKSATFVISTADFVVVSKPGWMAVTVSGTNLTAKTTSEHNTSNTARSGNIVISSSEDSSISLTIPVSQNGNVYIISTTTEETWSSGWHCVGCDDVRDYEWRYEYTWTDGSVTYSSEYSDEDRDSNWSSCVEAVGSSCSDYYGSWSGWGAKVYGSPQSSCSGSTEVIVTPWTQQRSRTITTTCTWNCTGAAAPGGGSRTDTEEQSGSDTRTVTNSSNCVTLLYTETCYAYTFMGCEGRDWRTGRYKEDITITHYYSNGTNDSSDSSSSLIVDSDCMCFPDVEQCQEVRYEDSCTRN